MTEKPDNIYHHDFTSKKAVDVQRHTQSPDRVASESVPDNVVSLDLDNPEIERFNQTSDSELGQRNSKDQMLSNLIGSLGFESFFKKTEMFITTMKKLKEMRDFLESLRVVTTNDTQALRENLVSKMTFHELCTAVNESTVSDWQQHPSYYKTLARRFNIDDLTKLMQDEAGMDTEE